MDINNKIKVLIIEDTILIRDILIEGLSGDPGLEIVGTAPDYRTGHDLIVEHKPDVVILDIEIPRSDAIEFLRQLLPNHTTSVIVLSSLTQKAKHHTLQALESGAVEYATKPISDLPRSSSDMIADILPKIKIAAVANVTHWKNRKFDRTPKRTEHSHKSYVEPANKVIAIGASTGGVESLRKIITLLPANTPGVIVVQHMPPGFTKTFADRLNELSMMEVKEAETGDKVLTGRVLIAPADYHTKVVRSEGHYHVVCENGEKVNGQRPSVDVLMMSVAEHAGANAIGVILTGMGNDGAIGLKAMKNAGAKTIGQDESTSIVYGMPFEAFEIGAVDIQLPLDEIGSGILKFV